MQVSPAAEKKPECSNFVIQLAKELTENEVAKASNFLKFPQMAMLSAKD